MQTILPKNQYNKLWKKAEEYFKNGKYLQAFEIYEELQKTKHGIEILICKKICEALPEGKITDEVIEKLCTMLYSSPINQLRVPSIFYKKLLSYILKRMECESNIQIECFYILTCFHR